jgi:hypothetical protein
MESLLFLLVALGIIALGTTIVLLRAHEPKGEYRGIKSFQKEMKALSPDGVRNATPAEGIERPAGFDPLVTGAGVTTFTPAETIDPQPADSQE